MLPLICPDLYISPTISLRLIVVNETIPIINQAKQHGNKLAVVDSIGEYTYDDLLRKSESLAMQLQNTIGGG